MNWRSRTFFLSECSVGTIAVYLASRWSGSVTTALVSAVWFGGLAWRYSSLSRTAVLLARLSRTDDLTGLANDRSFREDLPGRCAGLILFDLDGFKSFNDTNGHPAGDEVIRTLGGILRGLPKVYRIGGDEFAALVDEPDLERISELANEIQTRIRNHPWALRQITASFGVAMTGSTFDAVELRLRADRALYQAKHQGGNQVCVWKSDTA